VHYFIGLLYADGIDFPQPHKLCKRSFAVDYHIEESIVRKIKSTAQKRDVVL